jgi:hypothetical protein
MNIIKEILSNKPLIIAAVSWLTAGVFKVLVELRLNKKLVISRIVGAGGMPSSHTSTVVALVIALGYYEGVNSATFALAVIFTIIVIHDAVGVRLETGKQAKVLNTMMFETNAFKELDFETALKEYVGHTPSQAFVGALVGIATATIMIFVVYGNV